MLQEAEMDKHVEEQSRVMAVRFDEYLAEQRVKQQVCCVLCMSVGLRNFFMVFCHRQYCCCRHCQQLRRLIFTSAAAGYASKSICFSVCLSVRKQDNSKTCNIFSCHIILTVMFHQC